MSIAMLDYQSVYIIDILELSTHSVLQILGTTKKYETMYLSSIHSLSHLRLKLGKKIWQIHGATATKPF